MTLCKNSLHELRGPADLMSGECRQCWEIRQRRFRARRETAMALFRDIETRAETIGA